MDNKGFVLKVSRQSFKESQRYVERCIAIDLKEVQLTVQYDAFTVTMIVYYTYLVLTGLLCLTCVLGNLCYSSSNAHVCQV